MNEHRVSLQPAVILHQRPFSDTSAIIEMLTRDYGRVAVLAQGVKRKTSKWRASLQSFQLLQISWSGRGDLPRLSGVEPLGGAHVFIGETLFSALYINELLIRLLHRNDSNLDLFRFYLQVLDELATDVSPALALRNFEFQLLRALGYELALDVVADTGEAVKAEESYRFVPGVGVFHAQAAQGALPGSHLIAIAEQKLAVDTAAQKTAQRISRLALDHLLGNTPLRTRSLFKAFKQQLKGPAVDQKVD